MVDAIQDGVCQSRSPITADVTRPAVRRRFAHRVRKFEKEVTQQAGSHGYPASDPEMDAIFIASGYGVKPNSNRGKIANVDVASTIANPLNIAFPEPKGKPIPLR